MYSQQCYSHKASRTNWKDGALDQHIVILQINFKAQKSKAKTNTNPSPDPNRYRRCCPDPNARIQKFIHYIATPRRKLHRVGVIVIRGG